MHKDIYISKTDRETRVAILENLELVEFFVEKAESQRLVGNIYKGKIENVVKGISALFVDIGMKQNAFLPFSEISDSDSVIELMNLIRKSRDFNIKKNSGSSKEQNNLDPYFKKDQEILVQVIKEPFARKGARVTTDISLPGRFIVLVPFTNYIGISKKIVRKKEKIRLKKIAKAIKPDNFGLIIRTVCEKQDDKAIEADLASLMEKWKQLLKNSREATAPDLVFSDVSTTSSVMRDLMTADVDKIIVDKKNSFKQIQTYIKSIDPAYVDKLEYYNSKKPLFDQFDIEKQYNKSLQKKIWLKSGGFIIIEHTEAMTTVDVNSGKFISKKNHERTSVKTNLEAAREVARQLRLRDIGGLIVIDFIDMLESANKINIFNELKKELQKDRAKVALSQISEFGLLEMTRQRTRVTLIDTVSEECPLCLGAGRITSKASLVTQIESWFRRFRAHSKERRVSLFVHPELATYLKESTNNIVFKLQIKHLVRIKLIEDISINVDDFKIFSAKKGIDISDKY